MVAAALVGGCGGGTPPAPPAPEPEGLVRRHWDQACEARWEPHTQLRLEELFDTAGLAAELEAEGLVPPYQVGVGRQARYIVHYGRDGRPTRWGVWESTENPEAGKALEAVLARRMRRLAGLLAPEGFHVELTLTPRPVLSLAGDMECLPHMVHGEGTPPVGLPDTVRVWVGRAYARPGDRSVVGLAVDLDASGTVTAVRRLVGDEETAQAAEAVVRQLVFEPALRNGIPVGTELRLGFRFVGRREGGRYRGAPRGDGEGPGSAIGGAAQTRTHDPECRAPAGCG